MAVSGNPQLNIRLEIDLMDKVKAEADKQGMRPQEWVRRLIKETLCKIPTHLVVSTDNASATSVDRNEFEEVTAKLNEQLQNLRDEVETLKKLG